MAYGSETIHGIGFAWTWRKYARSRLLKRNGLHYLLERSDARLEGYRPVDLAFWLSALFVLGLATFLLMFAFVAVCQRV